jgi:hypothetical protein
MTPQEIKHGSPRTVASAVPDVDEPTLKDLIDGDRVFALQALNKYQAQTKAWRDHTVKTKASPSAYRLTTPSGEDLEHYWNIDNLRKFFV